MPELGNISSILPGTLEIMSGAHSRGTFLIQFSASPAGPFPQKKVSEFLRQFKEYQVRVFFVNSSDLTTWLIVCNN